MKSMNAGELTNLIKQKGIEIGFNLIGVAPIKRYSESGYFESWLEKGYAGEMGYMERNVDKRKDASNLIREAKSVISCALNYNTPYKYSTEEDNESTGWISRYAWGGDYHDIMWEKLSSLAEFLKESVGDAELVYKLYVDTGPVLDRLYAKYAGIGWFGKNTCIINQNVGSWIFLGEIITNLELEADSTHPERCGTCTRCIDACPTGALLEPYVLDSRLCISYLTIELKGKIPTHLRDGVGGNVFGCDICQDVCPWNRKANITKESSFYPREGLHNPDLSSIAQIVSEEFSGTFKSSPLKRTKRKGMLRNIMVAVGNTRNREYESVVMKALHDEEPLVRTHAAWALWKILGDGAVEALEELLQSEKDEMVRGEIDELIHK